MADFEELKLTVSLQDDASAGLANLRTQITGLTQTAGQVQTSFQGVAQSVQQVGGAAQQANPQVRATEQILKGLERAAGETTRGVMQMALAMKGGVGSLPQGFGRLKNMGRLRRQVWPDASNREVVTSAAKMFEGAGGQERMDGSRCDQTAPVAGAC